MTLTDRLLKLARLWCAAHDRSPSRLATIVANDGKLLDRVGAGAGLTVATFEKFLAFFRDSSNWPEGAIPAEAADLLDDLEPIAVGDAPSSGNGESVSGSADCLRPAA